MNKFFKSKLFIVSLVFILLGSVFLFIQNNYFGYVDTDGILHDSIFLPLGVFSTLIGGVILGVHSLVYSIKIVKLRSLKVK